MAKKTLSIVLAAIMLMSVLVVGSFAADSYELQVKKLILGNGAGEASITTTKYNQYVSANPNIVEENLYFWDDEIITAYNNATSDADWEALYDEMTGDDSWVQAYPGDDGWLVEWYPSHLQNGKAKTDVVYTADKEYIGVDADEAGRTITVQVALTTNFYCGICEVGIIYDKTLMDYVPESGQMVAVDGRKFQSTNADYGISSGNNRKMYIWPASMRENNNGEYNQYGMIKINTTFDKTFNGNVAMKFNNTPIATAQFVAKEGLPEGTELKFFAVQGSQPVIDDFELQETWSATLFKTYRHISPDLDIYPFGCPEYDQTYTFTPASVYIGEPVADKADYTALDAAIAEFDADAAADYKSGWDAYADAVAAGQSLSRNLPEDQQATVDNATAAITTAKEALVKNAVISAEQSCEAVIGGRANIDIKVEGNPTSVRLTSNNGSETFLREDAFRLVDNGDGTETWTVRVIATSTSEDYTAIAKYANWTDEGKDITVTAVTEQDLGVYSIYVYDMVYPEGNGGVVEVGKHKVVVETGKDVYKLQFVDATGKIEDGCTSTYCPVKGEALHMATVEEAEDGDHLIWTFEFSFGPYGDWSMPIRTRSESTFFATVDGISLDAYVVY